MKRRQALLGIAGLGAGLLGALEAQAQRASKLPVIGLLDGGERLEWWAAFRQQMRELGYVEGKNIAFELRAAKSDLTLLPALAQDLVRLNVAAIVTSSIAAAQAARQVTDRIPIVTATGADHVSLGLAASLGKPGGNVTGVSSLTADLAGKRLELLRELLPKLSRVAVVWQADNPGSVTTVRELERVVRQAKLSLQVLGVRKPQELAGAFEVAAKERAEAVFLPVSPLIHAERKPIAALAIKHKMACVGAAYEFVEAGALISYGTNYYDLFKRAAVYVDKILKGAKPGELPIEQPTKIELTVNLKTAKALGLAIPKPFLLRADRVIE